MLFLTLLFLQWFCVFQATSNAAITVTSAIKKYMYWSLELYSILKTAQQNEI